VELKINYPKNSFVNNNKVIFALYQRYGGLLLGYITEVVKDKTLAEQCLVEVFKEVLGKVEEFTYADNAWIGLQRLAKKVLLPVKNAMHHEAYLSDAPATNNYMQLMNHEQGLVFYGLHYQQKDIATLAKELNKTEDIIRQLLREALIIIRNEQKR
jgi:hypothetical protein